MRARFPFRDYVIFVQSAALGEGNRRFVWMHSIPLSLSASTVSEKERPGFCLCIRLVIPRAQSDVTESKIVEKFSAIWLLICFTGNETV
jgi:hypothetical protein